MRVVPLCGWEYYEQGWQGRWCIDSSNQEYPQDNVDFALSFGQIYLSEYILLQQVQLINKIFLRPFELYLTSQKVHSHYLVPAQV